MKRWTLLFILAGWVFSVGSCPAQEPSRGPDGRTSVHIPGVEVLSIPGKPFSAKSSTDWIRTLPDGSTVTFHLDAFLARDGRGRIYRENHSFVPAGSTDKAPLYQIHLYDPNTRTQLLCAARTFRCYLSGYTPQTFFDATPPGDYANATHTLTRDELGSDIIAGLHVRGTRETTTYAPGTFGSDRPIVLTNEYWYSEELETNLAITRMDPAVGKQIIRLSDIILAEPDPHLWDVPIGFTVRDQREPARRER